MASKDWVKFNEDSRAASNRANHVAKYGGEFTNRGKNRGWCWSGGGDDSSPAPKKATTVVNTRKKLSGNKKKDNKNVR